MKRLQHRISPMFFDSDDFTRASMDRYLTIQDLTPVGVLAIVLHKAKTIISYSDQFRIREFQ